MTSPRYAKAAGTLLARIDLDPPAPSSDDRARAIAAIEEALRARRSGHQRGRALRVVAALAVAACVAGIGIGIGSRAKPAAPSPVAAAIAPPAIEIAAAPARVIAHTSGPDMGGTKIVGAAREPLVEGESLAPGSRIVARAGAHAILAFSAGTRLTVEEGGDVTLVDGGPNSVVALSHGALRADVAAMSERERFLVRTDDAELDARGSSFRVASNVGAPCAEAATRVDVYEGVVVVRHGGQEARVTAGESWPPACTHVQVASPAAPSHRATAPRAATHGSATVAPVSSLAAQNDLFGAAVAAKRYGETGVAIERFDEFVARYPTSPLAESASAQRMKLLHGVDPGRAASAARAYLARWPDGFARAEAEAIARTFD